MTNEEVFAALQNDKKYTRLFARKDAAIHAWVVADTYKTDDLAKKRLAAKRAARRLQDYEDNALAVGKACTVLTEFVNAYKAKKGV